VISNELKVTSIKKKKPEVRNYYNLDRRGFLTPSKEIDEASCLGKQSGKMPDLFSWRLIPPCPPLKKGGWGDLRGFTFIELIIVVAVLSIFAAFGLPAFTDAYADYKVESAANRISADIRYARSYAINTAATINVVFDTSIEKYEVKDSIGQIKHPFSKNNFLITMTKQFDLEGIDLYQVTINGGGQTLSFSDLGITAGGTIKVRYAGREKTITVSAIDGEPSVS